MWTDPRPLVFINACESVAIEPEDAVTYAGTLIGTAHASGVIGTEVRVQQDVAMSVAEIFFKSLLEGRNVGAAIQQMRLGFLAKGHLVGLVYTPFCLADVRLVT
jgi:hypothetical protein